VLVKKIILDKANRLYQLPPDLLAFVRPEAKRLLPRRAELIDLARLQWPIAFEAEHAVDASGLAPASNQNNF
jgi:hypothetical protein